MTDVLQVFTLTHFFLSSAPTRNLVNLGLSQHGDAAQEKLKTIKSTSSPVFPFLFCIQVVLPKGHSPPPLGGSLFASFQDDPPRLIMK